MKDNTLLYVGVGVLAVVLLTKKKAALPVPMVTVGPLTPAPINQQQGLLLPFFNLVQNSVSTFMNKPVNVPAGTVFTPITTPGTDAGLSASDASGTTFFQTPTGSTLFQADQGISSDQVQNVNLSDNSPSGQDFLLNDD